MESSRRPFDNRSRELGLKKPRLMMEDPNNPNSRPFTQRQVGSGITTLSSTRFRANDRDSEGGYQPQPPPPQQNQELVNQYKTAIAELTFNSKPIITNLTIIAGENQSAAKAIAATVCANILEVPSEQKLPSLYLLDSIVKNIGQDYIKYFAAKLPEVFCKAYRQVEPSVHQSMRHLFGTWKGVFPSQMLQMIDKELGFTPLVNGSASASATLRSDSQSQRPPHSIHVNPKYLERQCLQQTSRIKGVDDITGALVNSHEDPERPDRALGVSRPWADPSVNIHRDVFDDSALEKSVGASYGGNEYSSDLSRNSGSGTGRASGRAPDLGVEKSWYKAGGVAGTLSEQRTGFSANHSFSNTEAPKYHQPTQNINSIQSSVISNSWKNSEEEEYTWDGMNSRLTGHTATNPWTADDENLEVDDHFQIRNPFGENVDREMATESLGTEKKQFPAFRRHSSLPQQLQEQQSLDGMNKKSSHSEGYLSTIGRLPENTNSATRKCNRPFLSNTTTALAGIVGHQQFHLAGAESPSGKSPLQQSSSPPVNVHHPQMRNLGGLQSQYIKDSSPPIPPNVQVGDLRRSHQKDSQGPLSSLTSFQPRHQQQLGLSHTEVSLKTEKPPVSRVSLPRETSEQSTTSSLEGATVKSGIFPNLSTAISLPARSRLNTGNLPSQLGVRSSQLGGPSSSVSAIAAPSSLPSNVNSSALPKKPERKAGQLPRPSTLPSASSDVSSTSAQTSSATSNALNPITNLLSSLVAKGLISAESESRTKAPSEILARLEDQRESTTTSSSLPVASASDTAASPVPSPIDDIVDTAKSPISLSESTSTEIRNRIGFEFKPDVIRKLHPSVIKGLFDALPQHCSVCGLGFKFQEQLNRHLEWHSTRESEKNDWVSRQWFPKSSDWIIGKTEFLSVFTESVDTYGKETERSQEDAMVQADENQCLCVLCGEVFEDFYCQQSGEWMFKGTVYMTHLDSNSETGIGDMSTASGPIIHARCLSENSISSVVKMEQD